MAKVNAKYISDGVQRILAVQKILAGNELKGLSPGEVAKSCNITPSNATRALHNLLQAGVAEEHPMINGRWRLCPSYLTRTANALARELDTGLAAINDLKRYQTQ